MRKIATVPDKASAIKRLMIYDSPDGVYLFGYDTLKRDASGLWDYWFETLADAEEASLKEYGVKASDWQLINDPLENCQHDIIEPVRIKGRADGQPQWGQLEKLVDGQWQPFQI